MTAPRICVAGIDPESGHHVRPITGRAHSLTRQHLVENGGVFQLGGIVDLGQTTAKSSPPETEDHWFWPDQACFVERLAPGEYLELLDEVCVDDLNDVLGPELHRQGWKYAVDAGVGSASLGCLRVRRRVTLEVNQYGNLQIRLDDVSPQAYLSVTDIRFVEGDHRTLRTDVIERVQARLRRGVPLRLMLGLARAFVATGDDTRRHWLQVNGLCLEDDPYEP